MRKKLPLLLAMSVFGVFLLSAQTPKHPKYIKNSGEAEKFYTRYAAWQAGQPYSADPAAVEDEEFFISRVKIRDRFTNQATQVNPALNPARKFLWWCPIGSSEWNALPAYYFDSEVWNMWSYLDHYGNWTAGFVRMPAAMLDICHKNGIGSSVVAAVGFGATVNPTDGGAGQNFQAITDGGAAKFVRYLRYYGIDGIGFNSEFNFSSVSFNNSFQDVIGESFALANTNGYWPNMTNCWYSITDNSGRLGSNWDALFDGNKNWFNNNGKITSNYFFLNYNWGSSHLGTSQSVAKSFPGRSSYDVYAGLDFQGRSSAPMTTLQSYEISFGCWGAHSMNMPYESRTERGAIPAVKQRTYLDKLKTVFSGGTHNPLNTIPLSNSFGYGATMPSFGGFGKLITARSPLMFNLAKEPFITYFNLGNGTCFREKGVVTFPKEWYNIGVQDFMPTWQFWFSNKFRGQNPSTDLAGTNLKAEFTWDDAWFGGSSLKISGKTTKEYLQLFKTQIRMATGDQIVVRYKLVSGTGNVYLTASAETTEGTELSPRNAVTMSAVKGEWVTATIPVGSNVGTMVNLNGKNLALLGLRFENTSADFEILLGEVTVKRPTAVFPIPAKPTLTLSKLLGANYKGLDFKLVYKMADRNSAKPEDPIYNSDVNTWYFKVWSQQEGEDPVFCVNTTSWAAYVVSAPFNLDGAKRVRIGVSAVGISGIDAESEIAWSNYMDVSESLWRSVEGLNIDKPVIKPNETFTIEFEDPTHALANFEIVNALTQTVVERVDNVRGITLSLPAVGTYDVRTTSRGVATTIRSLIMVSPESTGRMPKIVTMSADKSSTNAGDPVKLTKTYEAGEGTVSQGVRIKEPLMLSVASGINTNTQPWTYAFWFNADPFNPGTVGVALMQKVNKNEGQTWTESVWGEMYTCLRLPSLEITVNVNAPSAGTPNYEHQFQVIDDCISTGYSISPNVWNHIAVTYSDIRSNKGVVTLYFNGRKIFSERSSWPVKSYNPTANFYVGGGMTAFASLTGLIDEVQVWQKALTDAEIVECMQGYTVAPDGLNGYFTFEEVKEDASGNKYFPNLGSKKNINGYISQWASSGNNTIDQPVVPTLSVGVPMKDGVYPVRMESVKWILDGSSEVTVDTDDNATAVYSAPGNYSATLTLTNSWGSMSKTLKDYITVITGIADTEAEALMSVYPNPFMETANIRFADAGSYTVDVFNAGGQKIASKAYTAAAGDICELSFDAPAGQYYVIVMQGEKCLKSFKVEKK